MTIYILSPILIIAIAACITGLVQNNRKLTVSSIIVGGLVALFVIYSFAVNALITNSGMNYSDKDLDNLFDKQAQETPATGLDEEAARNLLIGTIQTDGLYKKFTTFECLAFYTDVEKLEYFEFTIREIHGNGCAGDPQTHPRVDTFRVIRATGEIFYYDVSNNTLLPYNKTELKR